MKISFASGLNQRERADLLVLPFWEGGEEAGEFFHLKDSYQPALALGDFKGKKGETALLYVNGEREKRFLLLGLGKRGEVDGEVLRWCYGHATRAAVGKKVKVMSLFLPKMEGKEPLQAVAEGVFLANYEFLHLKGDPKEASSLVEELHWIGLDPKEEPFLRRIEAICSGVYFVRDLVNGNADDVTPKALADAALSMEAESSQVQAKVFSKDWLEKEKMGLILAVNRGSHLDPFFIQASYRGNPNSKEHVVLAGKGITYDTGGLNLKVGDGMLTMKSDMAGGATVLGAVRTAAQLGLKVNVTAVVPATENSIGPKSYKQGDVYRSCSGKTVEIKNTDGEGRLVLADAVSYAARHLKPTSIVDVATLTGSVVIALGEEIAGLFSNDQKLADALLASSKRTGELLCEMPLHAPYKEQLKSDYADLVNTAGREAGAIKAALFLQEFVGSVSWAHLDIAGPAFRISPKSYHPTYATGFGLRLLIDFLETFS